MPNIVILDGYTLNPGDLDWSPLSELGELTVYERTSDEELLSRSTDAQVLIVNKRVIDAATLRQLPKLRLIAVTATGYNNVDTTAAAEHGVRVVNVAGYSTPAVVQHVFALLTTFTNRVAAHNARVQAGAWSQCADFSFTIGTLPELSSLRLGIYGFGRIGQAVAKVALAYGMEVLAHHKHPKRDAMPGVTFVSLPTLFERCNVVTLHAPLNAGNQEIIDATLLRTMPRPAYLINTGRGGLVNETALAECLRAQVIDGAALDVLQQEPPPPDHPLLEIENCIITPHVAWATLAARQRLLRETAENIRAFLAGKERNVIF